MCLKSRDRYILIGATAILIIFLLFCPIYPKNMYNETMFTTFLGLTFHDGSIFASLCVGIGTILITKYSIEKSYKAMKLTSLPDNSANLLIDLELSLNKYGNSERDEIVLLTEILKYWKNHQKAFRLLTPNFYKNFLKIVAEYSQNIKNEETIENTKDNENQQNNNKKETIENTEDNENQQNNENEKNSIENSKYFLKALVAQITNIAFDNDDACFSFIKPDLIEDNTNIRELGNDLKNYTKVKMTKNDLFSYIKSISDDDTKKLTKEGFEKLTEKFKNLLDDLKIEIEEYD